MLNKVVTADLTTSELSSIQTAAMEAYGVDEEDVNIETFYQTTGTINTTFSGDLDMEAFIAALEEGISAIVDVHKGRVEVTIDDDGVVSYVVSGDTFDHAVHMQDILSSAWISVVALNEALGKIFPVQISAVNTDEDFQVEVIVTIDSSAASNNLKDAAASLESLFDSQGYDAEAENLFITAAPTNIPSTKPTDKPVTFLPSAFPTITGSVAIVSISGAVSAEMPPNDLTSIANEIAEIYGVDPADVETTVDYVTSGTLDITIPETLSEAEAIAAISESISNVLGIHPKDVLVTIDENGDVTYTITKDTFSEAAAIQTAALEPDFAAEITADLNEGDSGIIVNSAQPDDKIELVISATVDTTDATGTEDAVTSIEAMTQKYGLTDSSTEGKMMLYSFLDLT